MTFDEAAAALSNASLEDAGESTTPASDELSQIQQAASVESKPAVAPSGAPQAPTPAAPAAEESFTSIDPALLPPELAATYKSMQADYTRKQQALAAERTQYEQYGPPDELQAARELYQAIQDPSNWEQLHAELTAAMQEQGLSPAQAAVAATQTLQEQSGAPAAGAPDLASFLADPELAPLAQHVQALQARLDEQENLAAEAHQAAQVEQEQMALVGEYQRQEMAIRQNNPSYTDGDIDAIYELSSFHNGNLLAAQQRYDAIFQDRFSRYVDAKNGAAGTLGLGSPSPASSDVSTGPILDANLAHKAGLAALAALEAAGQ